MSVLRTPEDRFADVPDFPYPPSFVTVGHGLRLAYIEAGPPSGETVVLLHGEPSWSFLWRSVIPVLAEAGLHVVAPDLIGFGRSDKPADVDAHTYAGHVEWIREALFDRLGLRDITLVGHDWGGLIGLRIAAEHGDHIGRLVVTNTGLPTGDQQMPDVWLRFREATRKAPVLDVARLIQSGCQITPPAEVFAAYDAPFPDETYKAAVRAMPNLVPTEPDQAGSAENRAAWRVLSTWDKPFLVAFSDRDPITGGMAPIFGRLVGGARSVTIHGAGHFLQEDAGPALGAAIASFIRDTSTSN